MNRKKWNTPAHLAAHHPIRWGTVLCAAVLAVASTAANANKPEWAGQGKNKHAQQDDRDTQAAASAPGVSVEVHVGGFFSPVQRAQVQDYYRQQARIGHCPPGLAKKNYGCLPPGQAKKWAAGQPLPRDVVYLPVEPRILVRLGTPPAGHRFVQVAADILLIAIGTGMVIDAIEDLGR